MARLGFLAVGTMGGAMARRLIDAGHEVVIWNRSPERVDELESAGGIRAASAAQALACEISFSMFANDEAAEAVLTADHLGRGPGRLHVAMASLSPDAADRLTAVHEAAGVAYVACCVLGRPAVAAAGDLNVIAAGDASQLARVDEYLDIMGKRTWVVGSEPRTANVVKAAVNYNIIHALQALGESSALVESEGVDAGGFTELLASTLFGGVVYSTYGALIAERRYHPPGFSVTLGLKDLGLAEGIAAEAGIDLATAPALRRMFETAIADPELGDGDWAVIAEITRRQVRRSGHLVR